MMQGTQVRVKVTPGARRESFSAMDEGTFAASVKEKPKHNAANDRVRTLLANHFRISEKKISIVSGQRGKSKLFKIIR